MPRRLKAVDETGDEPGPSSPRSEDSAAWGGSRTTLCGAPGSQTTQPLSLSAFGYYEYNNSNTLCLFRKVSLPVEARVFLHSI